MPPNTSSKLQPMDQGIIHTLKSYYRQSLLLRLVQNIDQGTHVKVTVLDAINFIHRSWRKVSMQTIRNCYTHAGFYATNYENEFDEDEELPLREWLARQPTTSDQEPQAISEVTVPLDYITVDDNLRTSEFLTDDDIVSTIRNEDPTGTDHESLGSDDEDEDGEQEEHVCTANSIVQHLSEVRRFANVHGAPQHVLDNLAEVEAYMDEVCSMSTPIQSKITDYFK